jgi:hypothetical protein
MLTVQAACLEPFYAIERDTITEEVRFIPERMQSTRYNDFLKDILEVAKDPNSMKYSPDGEEIRTISHVEVVTRSFIRMLEQFRRQVR